MNAQKRKKSSADKAQKYREKLQSLLNSLPPEFELKQTPDFVDQFASICNTPSELELSFQARAALIKLQHNPRYPGLNSHVFDSLSTNDFQVWESYVQSKTPGAYRIFWRYGPGKKAITLLMITPHP